MRLDGKMILPRLVVGFEINKADICLLEESVIFGLLLFVEFCISSSGQTHLFE